jgi:hypothetical protein
VVAFPDPHSLARDELASLLRELTSREQAVSEERRALHAQIDALRREFVDRLREEGHVVISGSDLLDPGSAGVREPRSPSHKNGSDGIALPEPPAPRHWARGATTARSTHQLEPRRSLQLCRLTSHWRSASALRVGWPKAEA